MTWLLISPIGRGRRRHGKNRAKGGYAVRLSPNFPDSGFPRFPEYGGHDSFPSGHATTICSLALALSLLYPRLRWIWIVIALLVSMSRVVIGAHYVSDVIMGAYVGIFTAFLLWKKPLFIKSIKGGLPY